jgi:hypothetical protein
MPKTPIDYKKSIIYTIICNTDDSLIYVGSTTDYRRRKNQHKTKSNPSENRNHNTPQYKIIRENGGWDNFTMTPVKEFPCENKIQLSIEEERIRKELNATLNRRRAIRTPEEKVEDQYRTHKIYNQVKKVEINEKSRAYYEANKEKISLRQKREYQANKEKIALKRKEKQNNKKASL